MVVDFLARTGFVVVVGVGVVVIVAAIEDEFATRICDVNVFGIVNTGLLLFIIFVVVGIIAGCVALVTIVIAAGDDNDDNDVDD